MTRTTRRDTLAAQEAAEVLVADIMYVRKAKALPDNVRRRLVEISCSAIRAQTRHKAAELLTYAVRTKQEEA